MPTFNQICNFLHLDSFHQYYCDKDCTSLYYRASECTIIVVVDNTLNNIILKNKFTYFVGKNWQYTYKNAIGIY